MVVSWDAYRATGLVPCRQSPSVILEQSPGKLGWGAGVYEVQQAFAQRETEKHTLFSLKDTQAHWKAVHGHYPFLTNTAIETSSH